MGIYDREYYRGETGGSGLVQRRLAGLQVHHRDQRRGLSARPAHEWPSVEQLFRRIARERAPSFPHLATADGDVLARRSLAHPGQHVVLLDRRPRDGVAVWQPGFSGLLSVSRPIFSTLAWVLIEAATNPHSTIPMIGASGAVMAVVTLFTLVLPQARDPVVLHSDADVGAAGDLSGLPVLARSERQSIATSPIESHLAGAGFAFLFKQFDLRWSRLFSGRVFKPRLRIFSPVPREQTRTRSPSPSRTPASVGSAGKSAPASVIPEEQLDAKLDEVLAKIAREGRSGLTEEELRVLQEASRRARIRRSDRP